MFVFGGKDDDEEERLEEYEQNIWRTQEWDRTGEHIMAGSGTCNKTVFNIDGDISIIILIFCRFQRINRRGRGLIPPPRCEFYNSIFCI